jgi:hypothetical protein
VSSGIIPFGFIKELVQRIIIYILSIFLSISKPIGKSTCITLHKILFISCTILSYQTGRFCRVQIADIWKYFPLFVLVKKTL